MWKVRNSGIIHQDDEAVVDEAVVIVLATGNDFSLAGSTCVLWRRLVADAASARDLADELVAIYEVGHAIALADVTAFLTDLQRERLIPNGAGAATAAVSPPAVNRVAYVVPKLDSYRERISFTCAASGRRGS